MVYIIIVVVLIMIIAPIIAVLPSTRQKEQMALRRTAMALGFSVQLTRIDDPDPDPEKYLSNTGKPLERVMSVVAYRLPRKRPKDWRRLPQIDWCLVRKHDATMPDLPPGWVWELHPGDRVSPEFLKFLTTQVNRLPADIVRIEEAGYLISAYWNEHGGEDAVNAITKFITECAGILPYSSEIMDED